MMKYSLTRIAAVLLLVLALDQISKVLILQNFELGQTLPVIPDFFNLTLTFNRGAAFGLFADLPEFQRQILLSFTTLLALSLVLYLLVKDYAHKAGAQVALAMVLGGAFGNILDRILYGHVVDFLDVYYKQYHWPAFNIADSCISLGVTFLLVSGLFSSPNKTGPQILDTPSS